jgi:hypothetical protein
MHIEPGLVDATKIGLSYATGAAVLGFAAKQALDTVSRSGAAMTGLRAVAATILTFVFFEVFPHAPAGVSEVHLILGSTLFLIFGAGPAALGLAGGLLIQSLFFAPADLPQYGMNVTTLLVPLFLIAELAKRVIPQETAYADLSYMQVLKLSSAYQGGVVAWVAFWAVYGQGFAMDNLSAVATFGAAYMTVILVEPLVDLAVLAAAKALKGLDGNLVQGRVYAA